MWVWGAWLQNPFVMTTAVILFSVTPLTCKLLGQRSCISLLPVSRLDWGSAQKWWCSKFISAAPGNHRLIHHPSLHSFSSTHAHLIHSNPSCLESSQQPHWTHGETKAQRNSGKCLKPVSAWVRVRTQKSCLEVSPDPALWSVEGEIIFLASRSSASLSLVLWGSLLPRIKVRPTPRQFAYDALDCDPAWQALPRHMLQSSARLPPHPVPRPPSLFPHTCSCLQGHGFLTSQPCSKAQTG